MGWRSSEEGFCFSSQNITFIFCLVSSQRRAVIMEDAVFSIIKTEISLICTCTFDSQAM